MCRRQPTGRPADLRHLGVEVGRDLRDQCRGDFHAVQFLHDLLNVAGRHPLGVEGEDFLVEAGHAALVLAHQLRLECAVAIAGRAEGHPPKSPCNVLRLRPLRRLGERCISPAGGRAAGASLLKLPLTALAAG